MLGSGESVQVDGSLVTVVKEALGPSYAEVPRVKVLEAVATLLRDGEKAGTYCITNVKLLCTLEVNFRKTSQEGIQYDKIYEGSLF